MGMLGWGLVGGRLIGERSRCVAAGRYTALGERRLAAGMLREPNPQCVCVCDVPGGGRVGRTEGGGRVGWSAERGGAQASLSRPPVQPRLSTPCRHTPCPQPLN